MKTVKTTIAVLLVNLVMAAGVYWVTKGAADSPVSLPRQITATSICPVAGCSAKSCHGPEPAPTPEPGQTMRCPKVGCDAVVCHAQERLTSHYHTPKGASLDLWILGLSIFTIVMILIALYV